LAVIKRSKIRRQTVELHQPARPSRIRRAPLPAENAVTQKLNRIDWQSREWEIRLAVAGILFFALAIAAVVFDIGEALSH
jgi:hypothetical protein